MMRITRRQTLGLIALPILPRAARAASDAGVIVAATGEVFVTRPGTDAAPVAAGDTVSLGDVVRSSIGALAEIRLTDGSRVHLGAESDVQVQENWVRSDVSLNISGRMVIDRRAASAMPLLVSAEAGTVTLADTRAFLEDTRDLLSVFVKDGAAEVRSDMGVVILVAGEGIDVPANPPPAPVRGSAAEPSPAVPEVDGSVDPAVPGAVAEPGGRQWSDDRVEDAFASVGLTV